MNLNCQFEPVVEDAATFTQFINMIGDISQTLFLAMHPEEKIDSVVRMELDARTETRNNEFQYLYVPRLSSLQQACR